MNFLKSIHELKSTLQVSLIHTSNWMDIKLDTRISAPLLRQISYFPDTSTSTSESYNSFTLYYPWHHCRYHFWYLELSHFINLDFLSQNNSYVLSKITSRCGCIIGSVRVSPLTTYDYALISYTTSLHPRMRDYWSAFCIRDPLTHLGVVWAARSSFLDASEHITYWTARHQ